MLFDGHITTFPLHSTLEKVSSDDGGKFKSNNFFVVWPVNLTSPCFVFFIIFFFSSQGFNCKSEMHSFKFLFCYFYAGSKWVANVKNCGAFCSRIPAMSNAAATFSLSIIIASTHIWWICVYKWFTCRKQMN